MNYVIGLIRMKVVAVLLGPSGVGLVGLFVSIISVVKTFAQLGVNESGVREVAAAAGSGDKQMIGRTVATLRRVCWFTGLVGWATTVAFAWPLARWTFGSAEHAWAIAVLGCVVLIDAVSEGQKALMQGVRRIGLLARLQIMTAILNTLMAVGVYWWLRDRGIVLVIILTSVIQLVFSWLLAKRIAVPTAVLAWRDTWKHAGGLLKLGTAFMYGALLANIVGLGVRALIARDISVDAAGIYQAAWALSGMFASFVLQAMGTDFYPRLTAVSENNVEVTRLVNEQIEIGMLITLPGLLGAILFAPWLMSLLYSTQFLSGADLLSWFAVGVFVQIVTWPLGMVQRAKGSSRWIVVSQTNLNVLHIAFVAVGLRWFGLPSVAWAFALSGAIHGFFVRFIAGRLAHYSMSKNCLTTLSISVLAVTGCLAARPSLQTWVGIAVALAVLTGSVVFCLRGVFRATGPDTSLARRLARLPGSALLLP